MSTEVKDVIIIGSGPAGDTAAIYCQRAGLKTILVAGYETGGQLTTTTTIENFPGFPGGIAGGALMDKMMEQVKELNCQVIAEDVSSVDLKNYPYKVTISSGTEYLTNNIIVATGAKARYLGLENEESLVGKGVSVCATCDGFFYRKKTICVVGGGNTAAIEALHLAKYAAKVYIIYRQDSFKKMEKEMQERLKKNEKIEFIFNTEVIQYIPNEKTKKLEKIKIINNKTKETSEMKMDGVFMAIGKVPTSDLFKGSPLELDKLGYIVTKPDSTKTNMKGIYACGDVANKKIKQAVFAAGQGCLAAMELQADYSIH
jgi:thioredoxin reductase (NADPH)